jgi:hypothetical protein
VISNWIADRSSSDHRRSIVNPAAGAPLIDPHPNEVAAPELAVDGHREIALAARKLQANTNVQTSFGFNGRFWPLRRPLFQGSSGSG